MERNTHHEGHLTLAATLARHRPAHASSSVAELSAAAAAANDNISTSSRLVSLSCISPSLSSAFLLAADRAAHRRDNTHTHNDLTADSSLDIGRQ